MRLRTLIVSFKCTIQRFWDNKTTDYKTWFDPIMSISYDIMERQNHAILEAWPMTEEVYSQLSKCWWLLLFTANLCLCIVRDETILLTLTTVIMSAYYKLFCDTWKQDECQPFFLSIGRCNARWKKGPTFAQIDLLLCTRNACLGIASRLSRAKIKCSICSDATIYHRTPRPPKRKRKDRTDGQQLLDGPKPQT